jgi:hypothetical protein
MMAACVGMAWPASGTADGCDAVQVAAARQIIQLRNKQTMNGNTIDVALE